MIGIVDYNAGNIKSVERALAFLNIEYVISKNPKDLENAEKLIFPGVGEAEYAMNQLAKSGFDSFLHDFAATGKNILGICLGSQIIFEHSQEGDVKCLGLLKGDIVHFKNLFENEPNNEKNRTLKIPQIGWNDINIIKKDEPVFAEIKNHSNYYFVHSYVIQPEDKSVILADCDYGIKVPSAVKYNNIYAFQFHPEKSGETGLKLLKNFCTLNTSSQLKNNDGGVKC